MLFRLHGIFTVSNLEISNHFQKLSRYMEISLRQLSKPQQDSIAHVQMISFN